MGGRSSEHEVSLASGACVTAALDPARYEVHAVTIGRDGAWRLEGEQVALAPGAGGEGLLVSLAGGAPRPLDAVFPALHGPWGEDGTVQGLCATAGLPCVGAGVAASAVAMDKALFKLLLEGVGLPTPEHVTVGEERFARTPEAVRADVAETVGYPCFSKPARLGSSVGISRVADAEALDEALALAFAHDATAVVERAVVGREIEVGVLGNGDPVASPPGEILYDADWYDYDTKYLPDRARVSVPADLAPEVTGQAQTLALRAYALAGCTGMARVDFFLEGDDRLLVSELNTIPGFTPTSAFPRLFAAAGIDFPALVDRLVDLALEAHAEQGRHRG
jgi:D-alanine-D-alanine ligase